MLPDGSQNGPRRLPGPPWDPSWNRHCFWTPFFIDFGSHLGSKWTPFWVRFRGIFWIFFGTPLETLLSRLKSNLGAIWTPFWCQFGTLLGVPAKSEKSQILTLFTTLQPHRPPPKHTKKRTFSGVCPRTPPETPSKSSFYLLGSILGRFWDPLGTPISLIVCTIF